MNFCLDLLAYAAWCWFVVALGDKFQAAGFADSTLFVASLLETGPFPVAARPDGLVEEAHDDRCKKVVD